MLGRDRERHELEAALAGARLNRSAILVISGEVGIGKTTLLDDAAERARQAGMRVLRARGIESEARVPFAGLFELLRPALPALARIPKPQRAALEGALALRPSTAQDRFAVGAATLSLLAAHAEGAPVAVFVDDAHWLDGSSADALLFAMRRLIADPIAVIVALRDGEPSFADAAQLPALHLGGLDRDAAAELVGEAAADRLYTATAGNPLALLELAPEAPRLTKLPIDAPAPVVSSVARGFVLRAESLPERTRHALVLAAASDTGELPLLERARPGCVDDLVPAETAGLVALRDGRVEFSHALARSAVYGAAPVEQRRAAHRALAGALPDRDADRRAWHLALATVGPDETAASALEQAGLRAFDRSAYAEAAAAYERAAALSHEPARLLCSAADAAWLAGQAEQAISLLDGARPHEHELPVMIRIEHLRGQIAARRGPVSEAQSMLVAAAERAAGTNPESAVVMLAEATLQFCNAGDARGMLRTADRAAELATGFEGRTAILAGLARGMALIFAGQGEEGASLLRKAVAQLEASDELRSDPHLVVWAAFGPLWLREAEAGRGLYERALELVRSRTALGALPELLVNMARDWAATDDWRSAHSAYGEGIALARETGQGVALAYGLGGLAWLEAREGREADCRAHAAEGRETSIRAGAVVFELWTLAALGDLELGLGRPEVALGHYEEWDALLRRRGIEDADLSPAPELTETLLRLGRSDEAAGAATDHERSARAKGQPWALARAGRTRGLLAPDAEVEREFEAALALHGMTPDVFETARTRLAYGARLRRAGRRVRAREELWAAIADFDSLGAMPSSSLARSELEATGETARKRDPSTLDQLTPQELQIALLLADGRTTRETAASMFLSPKTIEYHLRNVYRKLDVRSRPELAEAIARLRTTSGRARPAPTSTPVQRAGLGSPVRNRR
jgi:DNA-binding CsgD family transcriptional regulator